MNDIFGKKVKVNASFYFHYHHVDRINIFWDIADEGFRVIIG